MTGFEQQVRAAIDATIVHSRTQYSWFGAMSAPLPRRLERKLTARTAREHLLYTLRGQLYGDFYQRGDATPSDWEPRAAPAERAPMRAALSAANSGSGCWEGGWLVLARERSMVVLVRQGLELWISHEDCRSDDPAGLRPGSAARVRMPKEAFGLSPGFYFASGDREYAHEDPRTVVRLYWNVVAPGAVLFVREATSRLNGAGIPFKLKVLDHPASFVRCDAAVIYLHREHWADAAPVVELIHARLKDQLRSRTPALTRPLAPGLSLAEEPGRGESFGQHRCRLLADGIIRAHEQRATASDERLMVVRERFAEDGIDLERPHLNPGSSDVELIGRLA